MNPTEISNSPVLALEHNMSAAFEEFERRLPDFIVGGRLNPEVLLDISATVPKAPFIRRSAGELPQVHMQVAYLELLWAFIYSWMVIYEETIQKAQLRGDPAGSTTSINDGLVLRAEALWAWARGLGQAYTVWPPGLPSPQEQFDEVEEYYASKANFVFERATSFLLCHELAHALLGHLDVIEQPGASEQLRREMENEADQAAFSRLVGQGLGDDDKLSQAWAIVSTMLSSFYAFTEPRRALRETSHPPLHHRLAHLLDYLDFQGDGLRYYFYFLCRLVLIDVFPHLAGNGTVYEDGPGSLFAALDALDREALR